jgi:hypothetical protein
LIIDNLPIGERPRDAVVGFLRQHRDLAQHISVIAGQIWPAIEDLIQRLRIAN